ncbi:hypothetical protein B0H10DRAFT_2106119 [Mycena sp. CBHHK59/15]|nr:hypothetical protein B0H10DRAFT_2106119 [Mycena sp. CBHHK59/15]
MLHISFKRSMSTPLVTPIDERPGQVPACCNLTSTDVEEANASAGATGFPLSLSAHSDEDSLSLLDLQYPPSSPASDDSRHVPASNPCHNVPGLWFVKVGADASKILEAKFLFEPEFTPSLDLPPIRPTTVQASPIESKFSVAVLCLRTTAVDSLYKSLKSTNPTPEEMATAISGLEMAWPGDGTLFLDMNKEEIGGGKTWVPSEIDPTLPLDVTNFIQPGSNTIRFIQLTSMAECTFILYASRRECDTPFDMLDGIATTQNDDLMFDFSPSATISRLKSVDLPYLCHNVSDSGRFVSPLS